MGNQGAGSSDVGQQSLFSKYQKEMQSSASSDVEPYRVPEISYLQKIFDQLDRKRTGSVEMEAFDHYYRLREHPLYQRIRTLFKEDAQKLRVKNINFNIMLFLLSAFHIDTPLQKKYAYLFRLYDWDQDFKLGADDLLQTFELLFNRPVYDREVCTHLAEKTISKYGSSGFMKLEDFVMAVPEGQAREIMTLKFSEL